MCKFHVGDLVHLISDTEDNSCMTVDGYRKNEPQYAEAVLMGTLSEEDLKSVRCVWRDSTNAPHKEYYNEDSLKKVE